VSSAQAGEAGVGEISEELQRLLDEQAIVRTMHRYCRALDSGLDDEWADVFTEDAVFDTVLPDGQVWSHLSTREEFLSFLDAYPRLPVVAPKHVMVDPIIEVDGALARGESTFLYLVQTPGEPPQLTAWGHYRDRFRKEAGHWRILERIAVTEANAL
jgi:hypothetical protein